MIGILESRRVASPSTSDWLLNLGNVYGTAAQLVFNPHPSFENVVYYKVYLNGVYYTDINQSGDYIINLQQEQTYNVSIVAVDTSDVESESSNTKMFSTGIAAVPTIPTAYFKMDGLEIENTAVDEMGKHHGSTDIDNYDAAGLISGSANIDGDHRKIVKVPDHDDLSFVDENGDVPFTISFWVNMRSWATSVQFFLDKRDSETTNEKLREWQISWSFNQFKCTLRWPDNDSKHIDVIVNGIPFPTDEWTNVVVTYDGNVTGEGLRMYINNEQRGVSGNVGGYTGMANGSRPLWIGGASWSSESAEYLAIEGKIDEVGIWKGHEANRGQVSDLFNNYEGVTYNSPESIIEPITDLSLVSMGGIFALMDFTNIETSQHPILYYEFYSDGIYANRITPTDSKTALYLYKESQSITVVAVDIYFNRSAPSNAVIVEANLHIPLEGIFAYFPLDEVVSSPIVRDVIYGFEGNIVNAISGNDGLFGKAVSFDGNGDYIDFPELYDSFNAVSFSAGVWIKSTQPHNAIVRYLQNRGGGSGGVTPGWQISPGWSNSFQNTTIDNGAGRSITFPEVVHNIHDGEWHLVFLTWNTELGRARLWIDNVLRNEKIDGAMANANLTPLAGRGLRAGGSSNDNQYYSGLLEDIMIYEEEIQADKMNVIWQAGVDAMTT